ncbi:hypothetical protein MANES_07G055364v8 [Manihot esculenta]|uniref:Uncharacterized protein n=1 Tax=Manihot esculenta TaxID=3983 RepID=A0ACB7HF80_MANES|nr:hypothetical protein MANES_07G055364v8 [Manihot esculenta]
MQSMGLLSEELIRKHQQTYAFLHIGMIQVAVKPATRLGLNTAAMLCVRDKRHSKFSDSLLGVVESSLCDGPIFFQCFPNLTLSLSDPHIMRTLILDIKTMGYDMTPGSENLILIYRIHYKAMNTMVPNLRDSATKLVSPKGMTTLFLTNMSKGNLIVAKPIQWDQVNLPDSWILEEAVPPRKKESTAIQSIMQSNEGTVAISFSRSRSVSNRRSMTEISLMSEPLPQRSSVSIPVQRMANSVYARPQSPVQRPQSPTPSDMGYDVESLQSKSFKIMLLETEEPFEKWFKMELPIREQKMWNKNLHTIGQQLNRVENQVSKMAAQPKLIDIIPTKEVVESSGTKVEDKVLFKPMDSKPIELSKRLAKLGIKEDGKMKAIAPLTMESEEEKSNTDHELIQLENMLRETDTAEVNRIKYPKASAAMDLKPYYPRPSPINLQFEDTSYNYMQYDGTSIVEWNIDGLLDYQIKNVLQYMTMYATASRAKGNDDPNTAKALIAGFGGQLKGWWDFTVSTEGKELIFRMVKQEGTQQRLHFIGSLINLRCPDLSHFKWYKDTFFSLVFIREDSNNSVWKDKFLAGLPALCSVIIIQFSTFCY